MRLLKLFFLSSLLLMSDFVFAAQEILDLGFNGSGKVYPTIGTVDRASAVIQQTDGKLVLAVYSDGSTLLIRYNSDGSLDNTFNSTGIVTTTIGQSAESSAIIQQTDGKLVVAGGRFGGIALVRYNNDGSLDTSFNVTGLVTTEIGAYSDEGNSIIQQADGKLVVAGYSYNISNTDIAVVRYNSDGSLDTSFNNTGILTTAVGTSGMANSIIQQTDGKLVVAGDAMDGTGNNIVLLRYNNDGSLDTTFNGVGKVLGGSGSGNAVIQQTDGKLVVVSSGVLLRYNNDGSLDSSFNGTGKIEDYDVSKSSIIQQTNGKLIVAGDRYNGIDSDFTLLRYNNDGSLDTSFNDSGEMVIEMGDNDHGRSVIQQTDGKLVIAGYSDSTGVTLGDSRIILARVERGQINSYGAHSKKEAGTSVVLADMNGDGFSDIIIGSPLADVMLLGKLQKNVGTIKIISGADEEILNVFNGTVAGQQFGAAIAVIPDKNGDGIPDLVVGNPLAATLFLGKVEKDAGNVSLYSGADGTFLSLIDYSNTAGDHFGAAVAVGDVDNDGTADVIIGAPLADIEATNLKDVGQVFVMNGITGEDSVRSGSQAGEHFGAAVAADVTHDRLIVGSPAYDVLLPVKKTDAGRVQIFDNINGIHDSAVMSVNGAAAGDHFGAAVSSFDQDMDGDTFYDWAVGIPGADILNITTNKMMKDVGKVQFFSGINTTALIPEMLGAAAGDNFGAALCTNGDVNNDGANDIAIGSPLFDVPTVINNKATVLKDAGKVEVINSVELF